MASLGRTGFPRKLKVTHRYFDYLNAGTIAGTLSTRQYSCNGLYDPDITGVGHQPIYFDQVGALYDHYTVFRSTIKISLTPFAGATNDLICNLYIDDDTTASANIFGSVEQSGSGHGVLSSQAVRPLILTRSWDAKQFFGGDIYDNDNLQGTISANPTEQSYFTLQVVSMDGQQYNYNLTAEIFYEAVWDELKTIGTS